MAILRAANGDDTGVAHRDQHRAAGVRSDVQLKTNRASLIRRASIAAIHDVKLGDPAGDTTIYHSLCAVDNAGSGKSWPYLQSTID